MPAGKIYDPTTGEGFTLHPRNDAGLAPPKWTVPLAAYDGLVRHHLAARGASSAGLLRAAQSYHFSLGWADIAYGVGWDDKGELWWLRGNEVMGGATLNHNAHTVATVYIGNSSIDQPTEIGYRSLRCLERYLDALSPGAEIISLHGDLAATDCPGQAIRDWTAAGSPTSGKLVTKPFVEPPPVKPSRCKYRHQGANPRVLDCSYRNNPKTWLRGNDIAELQFLLNVFNKMDPNWVIEVDGVYGPATKDAVIRFQRIWDFWHPGVRADGIVGPITRSALCEALRLAKAW